MFTKLKQYVVAHKVVSAIVAILLVTGGYYALRGNASTAGPSKYVVEAATEGSVIASVSGTGQVQAGTTVDVTPKVSENVTAIDATVGEHVASGQTLLQLDDTNELQAEQSASLSLQNAQLSLEELQQVTTSTLLQDQNAVREGQVSLTTASTTIAQDYETGYDSLGTVMTDLQTVMTGLGNFVEGNDLSKTQADPDAYIALMPDYLQAGVLPYKSQVESAYQAAVTAYGQNLSDYQATTLTSPEPSLDSLFTETYNTVQTVASAVKADQNFITYIVNTYPAASSSTKPLPAITNTLQNDFTSYTNTVTTAGSSVESTINGITNDENSIANDQASLEQATETLSELTAGPTPTQLLSAQISVQSAQDNLETAQTNLDDTTVRAPLSGTVSAVTATVGEEAGSDAVTIVGDGEVAQITLNEIDAAKVQVGDPTTLTFDALPDLSLAGQVVEIDPVGTVSDGVVSYNIQIGFTQPSSTAPANLVKPGMSVTANIVTQADQNVIAVPNAAVTTSGGTSYVLEPATPLSSSDLAASANGGIVLPQGTKMVPVTVGISNDTMTEIDSGVNVGDQIITQTIKSSIGSTSGGTASTGGGALQLLGGGATRVGGGGGGFTGGGGGGARFVSGGGG